MKTKIVKKMKKSLYKPGALILAALFIISFKSSAQDITKDYHKEFVAAPGTALDLSNRYGDVTIESWNQDKIIIDVKVTIEMQNKEKAEKLMSYIDVQFSEGEKLVTAKTVIDDKFPFSGWGSESKKFSVDYSVKMPVGADLKLSNRYGNTIINELHGKVDLDIKYGDLNAGKLIRGNEKPLSSLVIGYGKASIDESGWFDLEIRYSPAIKITKSQALLLDSKYSKIHIGETSSIVGESRYDKLRIENISNLVLETGYTDVTIGLLTKKLDFKGSYCSLSVERIPAGFESLNSETQYTGVRLGIEQSASYILDGKVRYGGLKFNEENFKYQRRIVENNSNETSGTVGKDENPVSKVNITASYGSVKLF
jgi:hypothetical protein